ncbi:MAG: hypothetical protein ACLP4V_24230 [Methylocella sp.]|jgi:hypothetical protein
MEWRVQQMVPEGLEVRALLPRGLVCGQRHKPSAQDFEFLLLLVPEAPCLGFSWSDLKWIFFNETLRK